MTPTLLSAGPIAGSIAFRFRSFLNPLPIILFLLTLSVPARAQWAENVGGVNSDRPVSIAVDGSGNVYIAGNFNGTADFDPSGGTSNLTSAGGSEVFFAKYNSSGTLLWAKKVGGSSADVCTGMTIDASNNVCIVGYFSGTADFDPDAGTSNLVSVGATDIFFAKYTTSGTLVWAKNVGGTSNDVGRAIAVDAGGNVYITGQYRLTADFDPGAGTTNLTSLGNGDIFIAEYNGATGAFVMAKSMGGTTDDQAYGIGVDGPGLITITGQFTGTADFDPSAGTANLTSAGATDIFLAQYDNSGNWQWSYGFGSVDNDYARGIVVDGNGGDIYFTGIFTNTVDFDPGVGTTNLTSAGFEDVFFGKYDASGGFQWTKAVGGSLGETAAGITFDASGNVYITGSISSTDADFDPSGGTAILAAASSEDAFFAKYNSSGAYQWAKRLGDTDIDAGTTIAVDGSSNVYVAGYFGSTVDFNPDAGTSNLTSAGSDDVFFGKYQSSGALPVELVSLKAFSYPDRVDIRWKTATETNNYGFDVERALILNDQSAINNEQWKKIGFAEGAGNSNAPREYSFADKSVGSGKYSYRLKQIDRDGSFKYTEAVNVEALIPSELTLSQNYPNPFNPTTTIEFTIPEDGKTSLTVYDVLGRTVATLANKELKSGEVYRATFDASTFASGIYLFRLKHASGQLTRKLMVCK